MSECIFCRIVAKEIPATIVHEDDQVVAFEDLDPQAPTHILVIPRAHIPDARAIGECEEALVGHVIRVGALVAEERDIADAGFRLVFNNGPDAGQAVDHLHLHVLGGRRLGWPPG